MHDVASLLFNCVHSIAGCVGWLEKKQLQILRLTTPKLKNVWGPVRSG
jgi:hypothetical protein